MRGKRRNPETVQHEQAPRVDGRSVRAQLLEFLRTYDLELERVKVGNGSNTNTSLGFKASKFDGFYRLSTGVVIYSSNGTPAVLLANGVSLAVAAEFRWAPDGNLPGSHQSNLMDVGLGRAGVGILKVSGGDESARGVLQIGQPTARPAAAEALRGVIWIEEGGAGVADIVYVCMKNAADAYTWVKVGDLETLLNDHSARHENGGADEISVAGLSGVLADPQTPAAHATSHQAGGGDAIKLDDLAAPDDNTDLNSSATKHGLLPKLSNVATQFLNGQGAFQAPVPGVSGSFTTVDGKTITVTDGVVTAIV